MIVKPSIGFIKTDSDAEFAKAIQKILGMMTGNLSYPKAVALLLLVKAALDDFCTALAVSGDGGHTLISVKKDKRKALGALVRSLANDVEEECAGDLTVLLSSGFPIQKPQHFPIGDLPVPAAPTLTLGSHSGSLDASVPPVYGAQSYNWQVALASAPNVILQTNETTATHTSFAGLKPGEAYIVQANVFGTAGTSDWSQPTSQMVV
jgi:hypothetical protein